MVFEEIWRDRYRKNEESYDDNLKRVAKFCANSAQEEKDFYKIMLQRLFFPGGRTMSNAGIGTQLTLNNCFVAPAIKDSLLDIFNTVKLGALTHQRGGGIGYDFSNLRPSGTPTSNDAIASGPISFADVFNAQTATILQGNRRGANMGVLNIYHPDIEAFISAKSHKEGTLNHFNLSVMVDDDFMKMVRDKKEVTLHWPVYNSEGKIEKNPEKWKITKKIDAKKLWDKIIKYAYDNGEPGIFFYDTMNKYNNLWYEENIVCSNPCAEYLAGTVYKAPKDSSEYGGACNLGSLMLHSFVVNPFTKKAYFDYKLLEETIPIAIKLLDNIIDKNNYPSEIYKNYQERYRTIGLGYTGLADALVMLGLNYSSKEAREWVDDLTDFIAFTAYKSSIELAKKLKPFEGLNKDYFNCSGFLLEHKEKSLYDWKNEVIDKIKIHGIRNAKLISVAPTGTMSLVFGNNCSSGIEPIFSLEYKRKVKLGGQQEQDIREMIVRDYAYNLYQDIKTKEDNIIEDPPFITALDISVEDHLKMLAKIAKNVDMSVSKTINIPTDYPFEKCKEVYNFCWKNKIKGCTIFRPNELRPGIFESKHQNNRGNVVKCKDNLVGIKRKVITGCGSMHVMIWYEPDTKDIMEVFIGRGSSGGCEKNLVSMARLISLSLRGGVPLDKVIDQLESCGGCSAYQVRKATKHDTSSGSSCSTAIANVLKEVYNQIHDLKQEKKTINDDKPKCPDCGAEIIFEGGCNVCKECGWSKCG